MNKTNDTFKSHWICELKKNQEKDMQIDEFKEWLEMQLSFDDKRMHPAKRAFENIFGIKLKDQDK